MAKIAALGSSEFIVGFELAGIKDTYEASDNPLEEIEKVQEDKDLSIVIIEEKVLEKLDDHKKLAVEDSISPVFIPLSTEATQEGLRRLIRKSIGIDLWKS